jgi:L-lactate dehydrogenase complex protein LldE
MRVMLMRTCLADHLAPIVAAATRRLLERLGVEVIEPEGQTCCGQPGWTAGHPDQARAVARQALRAFAGTDPVVVPSGSCTAMVTHAYPELFAGTPHEDAARDLAERTVELTQFLRANELLPRSAAGAPLTVTYHDSCHMLRLLGERETPRQVLADAGIELTELPESNVCCGFGGAFAVTFPEVSGALGEQKARSAAETEADALVGCDLSCLVHIAGRARRCGIDLTVRHLVEVLDA